ncbi:methyl-accepting chemotaxis protein [Metabacillus fastidiosus]|uniref:methyl-accepting chemotaxis protein n=1 Tax=Metabacillus fastidiosus TaxID=1458 RepID=UPI002DBA1D87|nr:methyl-accepting chemotaxis protein [Metabacillus fastidiosus]MEC2078217.1 methyl-accepting chemotaxis protein [Metabacillus fastidiosus]
MKRTLTWKLGIIIIGVIFSSLIITSFTTYRTAYKSLYEAAGIEAYGCANITTGLLTPQDVSDIMSGKRNDEIGDFLNWTVNHKAIFESQYILDLDGKILAMDDNLKNKGFNVGDSFYMDKEAINMLIEMKHSTYSHIYEYGGMKRLSGYAPIFKDHDPNKEVIAVNVIDFDGNIVSDRTWTVVKDGILLGSIPLILATILTLFLIRKKTKPISQLIERTRIIADGDITASALRVKSNDEVGDLARNLNEMSANLREVISTIKGASAELVSNVNTTSASMNEMSTALSRVSNKMEEVASETSTGAEMTGDASQALTSLASLISSSKEKADASVDSAEHTMVTAEQGIQKVHEIVERMNVIKSSTLDTQQIIGTLSNYTSEIQNITEAITQIAEQTNLLALNAAIEAARAGENGKGFAVVADEVRKLAEQSNREASEVGNLVAKITASINETVHRIEESRKNVEEGEQTVNETGEALEKISFAVKNIVSEIKGLSSLTHDEAETSAQIVQLVHRLEEANENMSNSAQEVSAATEQTAASVEEVAARSDSITEMANKLNTIVNKFKL